MNPNRSRKISIENKFARRDAGKARDLVILLPSGAQERIPRDFRRQQSMLCGDRAAQLIGGSQEGRASAVERRAVHGMHVSRRALRLIAFAPVAVSPGLALLALQRFRRNEWCIKRSD